MSAVRLPAAAKIPARIARAMQELGPYAAIWLLLPGGSLIALGMWIMRNRGWTADQRRRIVVVVATLSAMLIFPVGA